uniref:Serine/threonineprotein phosphatase 6 regulatory subunit putative n=1 Tax=Albugo laibachii Nc14 TaxID=890382 RepID=F0WEH4_9STRA|nr:serine/threonineprotein phosphatase 6 regulatory subunit putative [Albugo laibachii Nc14]|eukprot:CCA19606.1 serine/threonineprotein phosphatase 6 regulatory subunit putative [Albugo laibachii Nc14]
MSFYAALSDDTSVWSNRNSLFDMSSPLNKLLEKGEFTLKQVLEEDDLMQEVKARNQTLIDFLSREESVCEMIEYISTNPDDTCDVIRTFKYPYMSCEVICCDVDSILSAIIKTGDGQLIETLFSLLDQQEALDTRLAGYFEKVTTILMARKSQDMTIYINNNADKLLHAFNQHVGCFSIAELYKRMLQPYPMEMMEDAMEFAGMSIGEPRDPWEGVEDDRDCTSTSPSVLKTLSWHQNTRVIDLLVENLMIVEEGGEPIISDMHKHTSEIMIDIIHCDTRSDQNPEVSPRTAEAAQARSILLQYLESREIVERIVSIAIPEKPMSKSVGSAVTAALSVLDVLLSRHANSHYIATDDLPVVVTLTLSRLSHITATLRGEHFDAGFVWNQQHQQVPRLGLHRIKLVNLIVYLLHTKYYQVDAALSRENVAGTCLDLFFQFECVNFLHAEVESIVVGILESASTELLASLIKDARLLPRILEAFDQNQKQLVDKTRLVSFGFMGHLNRICQVIVLLTDEGEDDCTEEIGTPRAHIILEMLKEDQDSWVRWDALVHDQLLAKIEQDRHPLGGGVAFIGEGLNGLEEFHQDCMNDEFTEMLEQAEYLSDSTKSENEYDYNGSNNALVIPPSEDESSSSEDDEEDHCFSHCSPAQRAASELPTSSIEHNVVAEWAAPSDIDHWARFEHNATFSDSFDQFQPELYDISVPSDSDDDSSVNEIKEMTDNDADVDDGQEEILKETSLEVQHSGSDVTGDMDEENHGTTIGEDGD